MICFIDSGHIIDVNTKINTNLNNHIVFTSACKNSLNLAQVFCDNIKNLSRTK